MKHMQKGFSKLIAIVVVFLIVLGAGGFYISTQTKPADKKIYHIGILSGLGFFLPTVDGLKEKMTELGYVEGKNVFYDLQKTNFEPEKEKQIIQKFIDDKVDLMVIFPTEVSQLAKQMTKDTNIPLVFANAYIEGTGLADSIQKPGANATGVRFPGVDVTVKRLNFLHELAPNAKRVYMPYAKNYPIIPLLLAEVRKATQVLGMTLVELPATGAADIKADLERREKLSDLGIDVILFGAEPIGVQPDVMTTVGAFADKHKLIIGDSFLLSGADIGPLFSYAPDNLIETGGLVAVSIDKIFKGIPAGNIPVASPESYLRINYKVAQKLNVKLGEGFLSQAKEILK